MTIMKVSHICQVLLERVLKLTPSLEISVTLTREKNFLSFMLEVQLAKVHV